MLKILLVNSRKLRIKEERKPTENEIIDTLKNKILKNNNDNKVYDKIPYTVYQTYQTKTLPVLVRHAPNRVRWNPSSICSRFCLGDTRQTPPAPCGACYPLSYAYSAFLLRESPTHS
jgi:hypothetical protein